MSSPPVLPDLSLLVTLPARRAASHESVAVRQGAWCSKPLPTFPDDKQALLAIVEEYRQGLLPLVTKSAP